MFAKIYASGKAL